MILALTPNPALDLTYEVDTIAVFAEHRVRRVHAAPGGKGVNVARVLAQLGRRALCAGPLGGATGEEIRDLLVAADGVRQAWTPISGSSRRTVTVVAPDGATGFHEPGPALSPAECSQLKEGLRARLSSDTAPQSSDTGPQSSDTSPQPSDDARRIAAVTLSGSLPPGLDGDQLAGLVQACREHERPVLVDTSGPALLDAARAGADVLKPNLGEALAATGEDTPLAAARALLDLGAGTVVCSLGADGMLGVHRTPAGDAAWQAAPAEAISGNPTGAGDSVVAVLAARLLVDADPLPDVLRHAVAVSASAVTCPVAGQIDPGLAARLLPTVSIEEIPCP